MVIRFPLRPLLRPLGAALLVAAGLATAPLRAEDEAKTPYWASIRAGEVNMRVGPGEDYRISWVYHRPQLPLKVLRIREGWRLVQDPDGAKGWVLARFLTRQRTAYVTAGEPTPLRDSGADGARLLWRLAPGVVGRLGDCDQGWCAFSLGDRGRGERKGFVAQARLFGAGAP